MQSIVPKHHLAKWVEPSLICVGGLLASKTRLITYFPGLKAEDALLGAAAAAFLPALYPLSEEHSWIDVVIDATVIYITTTSALAYVALHSNRFLDFKTACAYSSVLAVMVVARRILSLNTSRSVSVSTLNEPALREQIIHKAELERAQLIEQMAEFNTHVRERLRQLGTIQENESQLRQQIIAEASVEEASLIEQLEKFNRYLRSKGVQVATEMVPINVGAFLAVSTKDVQVEAAFPDPSHALQQTELAIANAATQIGSYPCEGVEEISPARTEAYLDDHQMEPRRIAEGAAFPVDPPTEPGKGGFHRKMVHVDASSQFGSELDEASAKTAAAFSSKDDQASEEVSTKDMQAGAALCDLSHVQQQTELAIAHAGTQAGSESAEKESQAEQIPQKPFSPTHYPRRIAVRRAIVETDDSNDQFYRFREMGRTFACLNNGLRYENRSSDKDNEDVEVPSPSPARSDVTSTLTAAHRLRENEGVPAGGEENHNDDRNVGQDIDNKDPRLEIDHFGGILEALKKRNSGDAFVSMRQLTQLSENQATIILFLATQEKQYQFAMQFLTSEFAPLIALEKLSLCLQTALENSEMKLAIELINVMQARDLDKENIDIGLEVNAILTKANDEKQYHFVIEFLATKFAPFVSLDMLCSFLRPALVDSQDKLAKVLLKVIQGRELDKEKIEFVLEDLAGFNQFDLAIAFLRSLEGKQVDVNTWFKLIEHYVYKNSADLMKALFNGASSRMTSCDRFEGDEKSIRQIIRTSIKCRSFNFANAFLDTIPQCLDSDVEGYVRLAFTVGSMKPENDDLDSHAEGLHPDAVKLVDKLITKVDYADASPTFTNLVISLGIQYQYIAQSQTFLHSPLMEYMPPESHVHFMMKSIEQGLGIERQLLGCPQVSQIDRNDQQKVLEKALTCKKFDFAELLLHQLPGFDAEIVLEFMHQAVHAGFVLEGHRDPRDHSVESLNPKVIQVVDRLVEKMDVKGVSVATTERLIDLAVKYRYAALSDKFFTSSFVLGMEQQALTQLYRKCVENKIGIEALSNHPNYSEFAPKASAE